MHSHKHASTHLFRVEDAAGVLSGLDRLVCIPVSEADRLLVDPLEDRRVNADTDQTDPYIQKVPI